jgi:hypothetical protein
MTAAERREKARLRSERWRRAHGIMPRKPARRPWLASGVSRSTYYRSRAKARQEAALAATFTRAEVFVNDLQRELAEAARCHAIMASIIGELAADSWNVGPTRRGRLSGKAGPGPDVT